MICKKCNKRIWLWWTRDRITNEDVTMTDSIDGFYHNKCSPFYHIRKMIEKD